MDGKAPRKLPVLFYRTRGGTELVRDWLRSLDDKDQNTIGLDLLRVQFRWPVGMPLCRAMGDGLWEMRTNLPSNRIARLLFCVTGGRILVLHGFIKKTQQTPDEELTQARRRKKEMESEGGRYD
jgi:phage-related protein